MEKEVKQAAGKESPATEKTPADLAAVAVPESLEKKRNAEKGKAEEKLSGKIPAGRHPSLRGARRSKVDPALMTILQHEAHKLRIFKLVMLLLIVAVVLLAAFALISHLRKKHFIREHITLKLALLDKLEKTFSDAPDRVYSSAAAASKAIRTAEGLIDFCRRNFSDPPPGLEKRLKLYRDTITASHPMLNDGSDFITGNAMLDMVYLPAGSFRIGSPEPSGYRGKAPERPQVAVRISKPFWIAREEVDVWQIRKIIPAFHMQPWGEYTLDKLSLPAGNVTWDQAMLFCKKLTDQERRLGRVPAGYEYRLPTEAEWEYACRAGSDTVYYWGNEFGATGAKYANSLDKKAGDKHGWKTRGVHGLAASDPWPVSAPPGSFLPNKWGLYDMSGNLSEWCYDYYNPGFYKLLQDMPPARIDPRNILARPVAYTQFRPYDAGTFTREIPCKSVRGGNWGNLPEQLRSAARDFMPQNEANNAVGFRPVLAPVIPDKIRN